MIGKLAPHVPNRSPANIERVRNEEELDRLNGTLDDGRKFTLLVSICEVHTQLQSSPIVAVLLKSTFFIEQWTLCSDLNCTGMHT